MVTAWTCFVKPDLILVAALDLRDFGGHGFEPRIAVMPDTGWFDAIDGKTGTSFRQARSAGLHDTEIQ